MSTATMPLVPGSRESLYDDSAWAEWDLDDDTIPQQTLHWDLRGRIEITIPHIYSPSTESEFSQLANDWRAETAHLSSAKTRAMHPTYQRIIGLGASAVPLILRDMERNGPDDWFWALTAITGENPITQAMAGNMHLMTEAWIQWGRTKGYLNDFPTNAPGTFQI